MGFLSALASRFTGVAINVAATKLVNKAMDGSINIKNLIPDLKSKIPDLAQKIPNLGDNIQNLKNLVPDLGEKGFDINSLMTGSEFMNAAGLDTGMSDFIDTSELSNLGLSEGDVEKYIPKTDITSLISGKFNSLGGDSNA